jgi:hypothetical protein
MAIAIKCGGCEKSFWIKDEYVGKRAKCGCGAVLLIPSKRTSARQEPTQVEVAQATLAKRTGVANLENDASEYIRKLARKLFVFGLLSMLFCAPLGIVALRMGNEYVNRCRSMNVEPSGLGVSGRILGGISVALFGLMPLAMLIMWLCSAVSNSLFGR